MIKYILIIMLAVTVFMVGCNDNPVAPEQQRPPVITESHCTIVPYVGNVYGPSGLIYCKVSDANGDIDEVRWVSSTVGGNPQITQLYDNGTKGDITANDGTFTIDKDNYLVYYYNGDGVHDGIGPVYYFEALDEMGNKDSTDPIEY